MAEMSMEDWQAGLPCEADGLAFCGRCKPKPFPLEVVVTDGGNAFHRASGCEGLIDGQRSIERRGGAPAAVRVLHREVALGRGYSPCLLCFPNSRGHS